MGFPRNCIIQAHFPGGRLHAAGPAIVQAKAGTAPAGAARQLYPVDLARLGIGRGGGAPLPLPLRQHAESLFLADLSAVRVHVGQQAGALGAEAFTVGNDIYFAPGRFQVQQPSSWGLIGHELAHVVQQRAGRVPTQPGQAAALVIDHALEREADQMGQRLMAMAGRAPAAGRPHPGPAGGARQGGAVQPFWLRQGSTVTWQSSNVDPSKHVATGEKKWWSDYLPAFMNSELPVYTLKTSGASTSSSSGSAKAKAPAKPGKQTPARPLFDEAAFIAGQSDLAYEMGCTLDSKKWNSEYEKQFNATWEAKQHKLDISRAKFIDAMYTSFRNGVKATDPPKPIYPKKAYVPKPAETASERAARLADLADDLVDQILELARTSIGKFPIFTAKDSLARVGCVKYGPSLQVPSEVRQDVYDKLCALEGTAYAGCTIHIVTKAAGRVYNLTLHRRYRQPNPETQANIHVE